MAIALFNKAWDRLKLTLKPDLCRCCHQADVKEPYEWLCVACQDKLQLREEAPLFRRGGSPVLAGYTLSPLLKYQLYQLKFHNKPQFGQTLAEYLLHFWTTQCMARYEARFKQPPIVTVIPPRRLDQTHSHLIRIARPFASQLGYRFEPCALTWCKSTTPQHHLNQRHSRWLNMNGALRLHTRFEEVLAESHAPVIVLDDLVTTGATMCAAIDAISRVDQPGPLSPATPITSIHHPAATALPNTVDHNETIVAQPLASQILGLGLGYLPLAGRHTHGGPGNNPASNPKRQRRHDNNRPHRNRSSFHPVEPV
ncbi:MAG: hypothetical protein KC475_02220 [Cyanobacteria bacterium HKST-UBA03]|nr:hypothetical protein [Cyanobacteria bacterium HKST-UBA03]